jgi:hypothetical protein
MIAQAQLDDLRQKEITNLALSTEDSKLAARLELVIQRLKEDLGEIPPDTIKAQINSMWGIVSGIEKRMERILAMEGVVSAMQEVVSRLEQHMTQDAADRRWRQRVQDVTVGFILIWLVLLTIEAFAR